MNDNNLMDNLKLAVFESVANTLIRQANNYTRVSHGLSISEPVIPNELLLQMEN